MIVHLLEFRVVPGHEAEVVGLQRRRWLKTGRPDGLVADHYGRRLRGHGRQHLAITIWRDAAAYSEGMGPEGLPSYLAQVSSLLGDRAARQYRVVASSGLGREGAHVLRVHRTAIVAGEVGLWEKRTLENVDRVAGMSGNLWTIGGIEMPKVESTAPSQEICIVVLTAWKEWNLLLAATGGRLDEALIDTERADLERPAPAGHFELLEAESGPE